MRALGLLLISASSFLSGLVVGETADKTIGDVVKMLQSMLDKSKEDGAAEAEVYAKYKEYCDTTIKEKTILVKELTAEIGLLGGKIDALQGSTGTLSVDTAKLKAAIEANEQERSEAEAMRTKEKEAFDAEEADLTSAISQMKSAIDMLADIGANQNLQSAADHDTFMGGYGKGPSLLKLRGSMKQALLAAQTFLKPSQQKLVENFLALGERRAPFTGTYTAQSGEIVGILTQMRDTFASNLEAARKAETAAVAAFEKFMETKVAEHDTLTASYDSKQGLLSTNDGDLATKKEQLTQANEDKAGAEEFLAQLEQQCPDKAKDFENRQMLRTNEEAAISKAIAILSDERSVTKFGKVKSTSFVQLRTIHRHHQATNRKDSFSTTTNITLRKQAHTVLLPYADRFKRVRGVLTMLQVGNPFEKVLAEIAKMQTVIKEEAKLDATQLSWCNDERAQNNADLDSKKEQITSLEGDIESITSSINDPETGLKKQITDTEDSIESNRNSQKQEMDERRAGAKAYATTIRDIKAAESLLTKAIKVLKAYYEELKEEDAKIQYGFAQLGKKEEPAAPETWTGNYTGQSGQSNDVIGMIEFILEETKKEEHAAHESEAADQKMYEESMGTLKDSATELDTTLVDLKKTLAENKLELERKYDEHDVTSREKIAIERYLEKIKPGCDFITTNFDLRESNRGEETAALAKAHDLISTSPSYQTAVAEAEKAALGECAPLCAGRNATQVQCKACTAGVSEPGYCAGHPGTPGC